MTARDADAIVGGNSSTLVPSSLSEISASLCFSSASRRTAFERLHAVISSLDGQIVSDDIARQQTNAVHVNSLVFKVSDADPILLIVQNTDTVDTNKVQEHLSAADGSREVSVTLAPAGLVEQVCGFPPGSVPPLGHSPSSLRTIVDEKLLNIDTFWGGGGLPEYSSLVDASSLLSLEHVETADIAMKQSDVINGDNQLMRDDDMDYSVVNGDLMFTQQDGPKPFFPVAPPPITIAKEYCNNREAPNPLKPEPVTIVGRITGVRQMAKRLVFADLAPVHHPLDSSDEHPWRSGVDGKDMAVQLIAGKTLCKALGDVAGPTALRRLKRGQVLLIKGKTNVGNRDSLRNWVDKKSLDVVVFSYKLLEESTSPQSVKTPQGHKSNAELRRMQLAASVSPPARKESPSPHPAASSSSYLTLNDVFPAENGATPVMIVDCMESVNEFAGKLSQLLLSLTTSSAAEPDVEAAKDAMTIPGLENVGLIGMDCEWRPSFFSASSNEPQPILLLQISVHLLKQVFLFDAQALFRPLKDASEPMTELEAAASQTLLDLFSSQRLLKVGFQLGQDLRRLASSYPHIPAFRTFNAVAEVATLAKKAMQLNRERNTKYHTASLSRVTEFLLGKAINKGQQVSDWAVRPMSEQQIEYAALDAAVSPVLFEKALAMAEASIHTEDSSRSSSLLQIGRWEDDTMFTGAVLSWRFLLLDTNDPVAIRKLKAKRIVGEPYVVTQRWHTGAKPPMRPSVPNVRDGDGPYTDVSGVFRMPSKLVSISAGKDATTRVDSIVGERTGRSKEKCVDSLLTGEAALPDKAKIEFHQRSGYVEFVDGVALFVNMPDKSYKRGYPNEWLEDGKFLTWYLRKHEWSDGKSTLAKKLVHSTDGVAGSRNVAVLFVRMNKGMFLCCGRCRAIATEIGAPEDETVEGVSKVGDWGLIQLQLELLDREKLQESNEFVKMVQNWLGNASASNDDGSNITLTDACAKDAKKRKPRNDSKPTRELTLAEEVLTGNVVGALTLALEQSKIAPAERSVDKGIETLKQLLSKDTSEESATALKRIQDRLN